MMYKECDDIMITNIMSHLVISYKEESIMVWWNITDDEYYTASLFTYHDNITHPEVSGVDII
jgi:hypothetical protein